MKALCIIFFLLFGCISLAQMHRQLMETSKAAPVRQAARGVEDTEYVE